MTFLRDWSLTAGNRTVWLRLKHMVRLSAILGSGALLLGLALAEPGVTESHGTPLEQLASSDTHSARNWQAFWRHHLGDWRGRWTRYSPSGQVKETFASSRLFTANPSQTKVVQTNRYRYADGRSIRRQWTYNIEEHSQPDGFAHPASKFMRGLALDNGSAAWLIPTLRPSQLSPFELFLKHGEIRHSVGVLYGKNGELLRTASIREKRGPHPSKNWSDTVIQVEAWNPGGRWKGEKRQILPDLSRVPLQRSEWQWKKQNQSNHFFPDGIILRCPERILPGQPFSIRVIWLVDEGELQTITAQYNSEAVLVAVTHQQLSRED